MGQWRRAASVVSFVMGITDISICTAYEARLIDGNTGAPAAGVYVVGQWQTGGGIVVPSSGCLLAITRTNEKGEFSLVGGDSALGRLFGPRSRPATYFYAPRYMERMPKPEKEGEPFVIVPDTRSTLDRLGHLVDILSMIDCGTEYVLAHKVQLLPLYRAVNEEALAIARTKKERQLAIGTTRWVDLVEIGSDAAMKKSRLASEAIRMEQE